jgi:hypothetical protein
VVEDSDWTIADLRTMGFSERVLAGLAGVTKDPDEPYIEFIERCSKNPDSIDIKINDLEHNSTHTRNTALLTARQVAKQNIYIIAYNYLVAVKQGEIRAGSPVRNFIRTRPALDPGRELWQQFSRHPYDPPAPRPARPQSPCP